MERWREINLFIFLLKSKGIGVYRRTICLTVFLEIILKIIEIIPRTKKVGFNARVINIFVDEESKSERKENSSDKAESEGNHVEEGRSYHVLTEKEEKQLFQAIQENRIPIQYAQSVLYKRGLCSS